MTDRMAKARAAKAAKRKPPKPERKAETPADRRTWANRMAGWPR